MEIDEIEAEGDRHRDAERYIENLFRKFGRKFGVIAFEAHKQFVDEGCSSYVKTIYIGYDFKGEMVAALYGHADYVEVAIALPETRKSPILIDAAHLTWRTLPVAAVLKNKNDLEVFALLVKDACNGVLSGSHTVCRDNEFFAKARREQEEKGIKPKKWGE